MNGLNSKCELSETTQVDPNSLVAQMLFSKAKATPRISTLMLNSKVGATRGDISAELLSSRTG